MTTDTAQKNQDKTQNQKDGTPDGKAPPPATDESSQEKFYSQQEVDRLIEIDRRESGRARVEAEKERDTYKAKATELETQLSDNAEELAEVQKQIDKMSSNDPELFNLTKERAELKAEQKKLRDEKRALDTDKTSIQQDKEDLKVFKRDQLIYSVADDYVNADGSPVNMDAFKEKALHFNITEKEGLIELAEIMGLKPRGSVDESNKPFVGRQSGHQSFTRDPKNPTKTLEHGFQKLNQRT